jgi:prepilin-type processing-associated H-X9-DG protein
MNFAGFAVGPGASFPEPRFGVGTYIANNDGSRPNWEPPNYRHSAVQDHAGTILLAEVPNGENMAGNDWPSFCAGPISPSQNFTGLTPDCFQLAPLEGTPGFNYGGMSYGLHGNRFNYLFHDNHVSIMKVADTVGKGTMQRPQGMWTMLRGD